MPSNTERPGDDTSGAGEGETGGTGRGSGSDDRVTVTVAQDGAVQVVRPAGVLDEDTATAFQAALSGVLAARDAALTTVVVDLSGVRSLTAEGVAALADAQRACADAALVLRVAAADRAARQVLGSVDAGRRLVLYPTVDEAVEEGTAEEVISRLRTRLHQLERAHASRSVIEQAKGLVMSEFGLDADGAFAVLRGLSRGHNAKLRDVAEEVILRNSLRHAGAPRGDASSVLGERLGLAATRAARPNGSGPVSRR